MEASVPYPETSWNSIETLAWSPFGEGVANEPFPMINGAG